MRQIIGTLIYLVIRRTGGLETARMPTLPRGGVIRRTGGLEMICALALLAAHRYPPHRRLRKLLFSLSCYPPSRRLIKAGDMGGY